MYKIKNLKKINQSYDYEHTITLFDVKKANKMVKIIENSRNKNMNKRKIRRYIFKHKQDIQFYFYLSLFLIVVGFLGGLDTHYGL